MRESGIDPVEAAEEFRKISEAYQVRLLVSMLLLDSLMLWQVLSDERLRKAFDRGEDVDGGKAKKDDGGQWEYNYDKRNVKADGSVKAKAKNKKTGEEREQDINVKPEPKKQKPDPCKPKHKCITLDGAPPPPPAEAMGDGSVLLPTTVWAASSDNATGSLRCAAPAQH